MIKLVVMDLDGTCLIPDPIIGLGGEMEYFPESLIDCSKKITAKFTLATGRTFNGVEPLLYRKNPLHPKTPVIIDNGARLAQHCGKLAWEKRLTEEEIATALNCFNNQRNGVDAMFFFPHRYDAVFFTENQEVLQACGHYVRQHCKKFQRFANFAFAEEPGQMVIRAVGRTFCFPAEINHSGNGGNNGNKTGFHWQNIHPAGVNKAEGIKKLLTATGVSPDEAIFAGDDENDRPVFQDPALAPMKKIIIGHRLDTESAELRIESPHELAEAILKIV